MFKYDPFQIPALKEHALQHREASAPYASVEPDTELCPCCLVPTKTAALPANFSMSQLRHMSPQYRFLYDCVKIAGGILVLILFNSGIVQLQYTNIWTGLSMETSYSRFWLGSTLSFISILIFVVAARVVQSYRFQSLSDAYGQEYWSVLLKRVPNTPNPQSYIRKLLKTKYKIPIIRQILLIPTMTKYEQQKQQLQTLFQKYRQLISNPNQCQNGSIENPNSQQIGGETHKQMDELMDAIEVAKNQLNCVKEYLYNNVNGNFSGNCVVVLGGRRDLERLMDNWGKGEAKEAKEDGEGQIQDDNQQAYGEDEEDGEDRNRREAKILIESAPTPSEIDWQNISQPNKLIQTKIRINYICLLLVQITLFLLYLIAQLCSGRSLSHPTPTPPSVPSLLFLSACSYTILPLILQYLQSNQQSYSLTIWNNQLTKKYMISFFMIRAVLILGVESMLVHPAALAVAALNKIVIYSFCEAAVGIVYWLVNPVDLARRLIRWTSKKIRTQQQLNRLYGRTSHHVGLKFGFVVSGFWCSIMFCNLIPIVMVLQVFGFAFFYWIDKLNFAKRNGISHKRASLKFVVDVGDWMQIGILFKPLANFVYWYLLNQTIAIPQLIMFLSTILYLVLKHRISSWILVTLNMQQKKQYPQYNEQTMDSLYRLEDPIRSNLTRKLEWLQFQSSKLQIQMSSIKNSQHDTQMGGTNRRILGTD